MRKQNRHFWIGIAFSVILILFLLKGTDFHKLADAFRRANYLYCIPMIVITLLGIVIRTYRWRDIMEPLKKASLSNLFSSTMIGFMANFVLPARIGEFIRAYLIGRKEMLSKSAAFATIVVERLFDTFTIILVLAMVLFLISLPGSGIDPAYSKALLGAGITFSILFLAALSFLILLKQKTDRTLSLIRTLLRPLPEKWGGETVDVLGSFVTGLNVIRPDRQFLSIIFYSFLLWGGYAFGNGLILKAFEIDLPLYVPFYLLVVQAVGVAVPSSPGFVGTYHAAVVAGLAAFHVPPEISLSFAILSHFLLIVPIILYGMVLLWKEQVSLHSLESEAGQDPVNIPDHS
jgi:uncharacterized protein (TIRG00374 family)